MTVINLSSSSQWAHQASFGVSAALPRSKGFQKVVFEEKDSQKKSEGNNGKPKTDQKFTAHNHLGVLVFV